MYNKIKTTKDKFSEKMDDLSTFYLTTNRFCISLSMKVERSGIGCCTFLNRVLPQAVQNFLPGDLKTSFSFEMR